MMLNRNCAPAGSTSKIEMLSQFNGYHPILAVGLLAAADAGTAVLFKAVDEDLIKKNDTKSSVAEEAAAAAKDAAVVAADAAQAIREMSTTNREEKICFEEIMSTLYAQTQVMKSMINSMQKLESGLGANGRICLDEQDNRRLSGTSSSQPHTSGTTRTDTMSGYSYLPVSAEPPHHMQMMPMLQRGKMPMLLNIRTSSLGINDAPPVPNQPLMNPRKPGSKVKFYNDSRM
ncbi:peroxisomal membrane protein PEX14-like [Salvia hispanica]|uniref:peroxisomal membrane protein PEX14-like n=1 Tax=Salvia hispanica TaxID=49212 RepID=UPI0020098BE4|nr:peroxisomal membrane protein PEX14-like [Salvia hispanica]